MPKPVLNSKVSFILQVKGAGFLHLSKNSFPLNHANRTTFDLLSKIPERQKKTVTADKVQTISRPHCLTVTVTRIFHRFTSLHWLSPDYFRWHFSHSQNTFFRDMKRSRLFVLLFYHIPTRFTTKAAVSKPQQNRNSC